MVRFSRFFTSSLLCSCILFYSCSSDDSGPTGPGDNGNSGGSVLDTKSMTIGPAGGSIVLSNGTSVVFPAGVVEKDVTYTVSTIDPDAYGEADPSIGRVIVECSGEVTTFDTPVEIRVPLPEGMTEADSSMVFGGYIDEESGTKEMIACGIRMVGGLPYAVVPMEHFSSGFAEWLFGKTPPYSAGPLEVPYYGQGESQYCWAASLQMVSQAAQFETRKEITDIIGRMGVDESGITSIKFRTSSTITSIIKGRTGVTPDRCTYDGVNYSVMKDYLRREIGVKGHPVAVHSSVWSHAVVVVGYDGNTFYIHDPASTTNDAIGYTARSWSDMVKGMGAGQFMVCLSVPKDLDSARPKVTVNLMNRAFRLDKPSTTDDPVSRFYDFMWDYKQEDGYALTDRRDQKAVGELHGEVSTLKQTGDIEIVNSSRTASQEVSIWFEIICLDHTTSKYSVNERFTVPANSSRRFKFDDVPVDEFRWNSEDTAEYSIVVRALAGGTLADEGALQFKIKSRPVEITSMQPEQGSPGTEVVLKGTGFGSIPKNTTVFFNGVKAEVDESSWSNTEITVTVPDNATTGPISVKNCDVTGKSDTFTVTKETTVTNSYTHTTDSSFGTLVMTANVTYSITGEIQGTYGGADYGDYYGYELKAGTPATLTISADAELDTYEKTVENSGRISVYTYHKPQMIPLNDTSTENWPLDVSSGDFIYSVTGNGLSFTLDSFDDRVWAQIVFKVTYDLKVYDSEGRLEQDLKDQYYNARTLGTISVTIK